MYGSFGAWLEVAQYSVIHPNNVTKGGETSP